MRDLGSLIVPGLADARVAASIGGVASRQADWDGLAMGTGGPRPVEPAHAGSIARCHGERPWRWMMLQEVRDELERTRPAWEATQLDYVLAQAHPTIGPRLPQPRAFQDLDLPPPRWTAALPGYAMTHGLPRNAEL